MESETIERKTYRQVERSYSQAERIINKFGGVPNLVKALETAGRPRHRQNIYRWTWPRERGGTGGVIPTSALEDVAEAARIEGVLLTPDDFDPRVKVKLERIYPDDAI